MNKVGNLMKLRAPSSTVRWNALKRSALLCGIVASLLGSALPGAASAGAREQAKRIHDRLAGTPPSSAVLTTMATMITTDGDGVRAAQEAMKEGTFYSVTLKNFATPWTNRDQTVFAPLNDYTATVIGMVRDDVPFNTVLSADIVYVGQGVSAAPAYSASNNDHYQYLEDNNVDLKAALVQQPQSQMSGIPANATAGVPRSRRP